jgi:hypothetical protein
MTVLDVPGARQKQILHLRRRMTTKRKRKRQGKGKGKGKRKGKRKGNSRSLRDDNKKSKGGSRSSLAAKDDERRLFSSGLKLEADGELELAAGECGGGLAEARGTEGSDVAGEVGMVEDVEGGGAGG